MAFTDVETAQVHEAVTSDPTGEDLCKLGILYSTGQGGEIDYVSELGRGTTFHIEFETAVTEAEISV